MSVQALTWLAEEAPDVKPHLLGTLFGLCNHADRDGTGAYPSVALMTFYNRKTDRATQNDLADLLALDLIREGDQRRAAHIPADRRPVVYDLAMAYAPDRKRPPRPVEKRRGRPRKNGVQPTAPGEVGYANGVQSSTGPTPERGEAHFTRTVPEPSLQPPGEAGAGEPVDNPNPDSAGLALLRALPAPWDRIGPRTLRDLAPLVDAALADGWGAAELAAQLVERPEGVRSPARVLRVRLGDLPPARVDQAWNDPRDPWCGQCDSRTRTYEHPDVDDGRPHRCPNCHPRRGE